MWFFVQLCSSWQDFNWLKGSRGLSAAAELLVQLQIFAPQCHCTEQDCASMPRWRLPLHLLSTYAYRPARRMCDSRKLLHHIRCQWSDNNQTDDWRLRYRAWFRVGANQLIWNFNHFYAVRSEATVSGEIMKNKDHDAVPFKVIRGQRFWY